MATHLSAVPKKAYPYLLSQLERTAAERYRGWAEEVVAHREGLLECAAREDEIADRAEAIFSPTDDDRHLVAQIIPKAKATYYSAFEPYDAKQQIFIQSKAERQGADAWQRLKESYPEKSEALDELSALERASANYLDKFLFGGTD